MKRCVVLLDDDYLAKSDAKAVARRTESLSRSAKKGRMAVYRCEPCGGWHIGHPRGTWRQREPKEQGRVRVDFWRWQAGWSYYAAFVVLWTVLAVLAYDVPLLVRAFGSALVAWWLFAKRLGQG